MKVIEKNVYTMYHSGMKIQVNQWGNSLAIRIPKKIAEHLNITHESQMELEVKDDVMLLKKPKYTLEELVSKITPDNIHPETDTGEAVGNEIW